MAEYDPNIIHEFAQDMYKQSKSVTVAYFFIGLFIGLLVMGTLGFLMTDSYDPIFISVGVIVGAFFGIGAGRARAFQLKLHAQLALCFCKIEENSRH